MIPNLLSAPSSSVVRRCLNSIRGLLCGLFTAPKFLDREISRRKTLMYQKIAKVCLTVEEQLIFVSSFQLLRIKITHHEK